VDLNGDGHPDILSGSYSGDGLPEMAGLFQVLWGEKGGTFKKPEPLEGTDGELLIVRAIKEGSQADLDRICTRPTAVDFDADGDLDLVVGNFGGTYFLFRGEGGGKFAPKSEPIMRGDQPLSTGFHSDPFFVDWDGDGDLDLITGSSDGGVTMVENTAGAKKEMVFGQSIKLIDVPASRESRWAEEEASPAGSTRVFVDDLDGDGKLDIILGDSARIKSPAEGMSKAESEKAQVAWQKELDDLGKMMRAARAARAAGAAGAAAEDDQDELQEKFSNLYQERGKFLKEVSTGFVWIYRQK